MFIYIFRLVLTLIVLLVYPHSLVLPTETIENNVSVYYVNATTIKDYQTDGVPP